MMIEVTFDPIIAKHKKLLERVEKSAMGQEVEHQTGPFGQMKPKKKLKRNYMPKSVNDEQRMNKSFALIRALNKIDSAVDANQGFGLTDDEENEDEEDDILTPKKISSEVSLVVSKASYEYVASDSSYTDESNPSDDVFYLPANLDMESSDTSDNAEEKEEKKQDIVENSFNNIDENVSNSAAARVKQQYNTGAIENAQIGNQGI